jgi:hypothetical protein
MTLMRSPYHPLTTRSEHAKSYRHTNQYTHQHGDEYSCPNQPDSRWIPGSQQRLGWPILDGYLTIYVHDANH